MPVKQLLLLLAALVAVAHGRKLQQSGKTVYKEFRVTTSRGAPDCFEKNIMLVNGEFMPTITVDQGDTLVVSGHATLRFLRQVEEARGAAALTMTIGKLS